MSKQEVVELLGQPSSKWTAEPVEDQEGMKSDWSTRWQYGDCLSSAASTAVAPDIAPDRVWVVRFDDEDQVIDFRFPIRQPEGPGQATHSPIQSRYDSPAGLPPK
ncbi:MAG: hypothetical protein P8J89_04820 [Phycisphaerales bacterium]|nr:hypothetical protein [Phycisphaerales bacterium]